MMRPTSGMSFALEAQRIAGAVPPFMVREGDGAGHVEDPRRADFEDVGANFGVSAERLLFVDAE